MLEFALGGETVARLTSSIRIVEKTLGGGSGGVNPGFTRTNECVRNMQQKKGKREKSGEYGNCSRAKTRDHRAVQASSDRYWVSRGASRVIESAYYVSHRALQDSSKRSSFSSRPPEAGGSEAEASRLSQENRFCEIPESDSKARNKKIAVSVPLPSNFTSVKRLSLQRIFI